MQQTNYASSWKETSFHKIRPFCDTEIIKTTQLESTEVHSVLEKFLNEKSGRIDLDVQTYMTQLKSQLGANKETQSKASLSSNKSKALAKPASSSSTSTSSSSSEEVKPVKKKSDKKKKKENSKLDKKQTSKKRDKEEAHKDSPKDAKKRKKSLSS